MYLLTYLLISTIYLANSLSYVKKLLCTESVFANERKHVGFPASRVSTGEMIAG